MTTNNTLSIPMKNTGPQLSESDLNSFELAANTKIPRDYRFFLLCQNGGAPAKRNFSYGSGAYQDTVLRYFLGIMCPLEFDLALTIKRYSGRIPSKAFPIAVDEFDNVILISQKRGSTNHVLFWDHEKEFDGNGLNFIASTLSEFLNSLKHDVSQECNVATITFNTGEVARRVLPSKLFSKDRNAVISADEVKIGEQVEEFGVSKTVTNIEIKREVKIL